MKNTYFGNLKIYCQTCGRMVEPKGKRSDTPRDTFECPVCGRDLSELVYHFIQALHINYENTHENTQRTS